MALEKDYLESLLSFWQSALFLSDWSIQIEAASAAKMAKKEPGAKGHIVWHAVEKTAKILILSRKELANLKKKEALHKDETQESIIVHELLHLITDNVVHGQDSEEALINTIARSLILLKRGQSA